MMAAISAVSSVVATSFMPPRSPVVLGFRRGLVALVGTHCQTLQRLHLAEPLPDRLGGSAAPDRSRRNVVLDDADRRDLGPLADRDMVVDSHPGGEHDEIPQRHAAGYSGLGHDDAMPADFHIVGDVDEVVDLGPLADDGVAVRSA